MKPLLFLALTLFFACTVQKPVLPDNAITSDKLCIWPHGADGPWDGITANGWFGYCNTNMVWITHKDLPESRCYLRIPEEASWAGRNRLQLKAGTSVEWLGTHDYGKKPEKHNYQDGQQWQVTGNTLGYPAAPLKDPFGPSPGTIEASVDILEDGIIKTSVTMKNSSDRELKGARAHFCFNHRQAPFLGRRIFVRTGDKWSNFNDYTNDTPYRGYSFGMENIPNKQAEITKRVILSETMLEQGGYFTAAIGGPAVVRMSSNSHWPCTDINMDFGDIAPGGSSTRAFYVGMGIADKDAMLAKMEKHIN